MSLRCLFGLHAYRWSKPDYAGEVQHGRCSRCGKAKERML